MPNVAFGSPSEEKRQACQLPRRVGGRSKMPNVAFGKAHKKRRGRPRTGHREAAANHNAPAHMPLEVLGRVLQGLANCFTLRCPRRLPA